MGYSALTSLTLPPHAPHAIPKHMTTAQVHLPAPLEPVFTIPYGQIAYRGAHGGRGSAKTRSFAKMTAVFAVMFDSMGLTGSILCGREYMNSLDDSSMAEIKTAIAEEPWLAAQFDIGEKYIRTKSGRIRYLFAGLRHNLDSVKSKARVLLTWIDEAENVSEVAWRKLTATVMREPNSEIWLTWNPEEETSATNQRFRVNAVPERMAIVQLNWSDNPWFPDGLNEERLADLKYRPDIYGHVWEGEYLTLTDAQIFGGRYKVEEFTPDPKTWDGPYCGGDFGYSQDPTAAVMLWIHGDNLYWEHEIYGKKIEIDDISKRVIDGIPGFEKYVSRWDSAQPGMISMLNRTGLPRAIGSKKGKGSVEDGIQFMRSFKQIIIHPRCVNTIKEHRLYKWKTDQRSGDILPVPEDDWNHCIDAGRYALEPIMRSARFSYKGWT